MAIHVGGNGPTYIFSWKCVVVIKKKKKKNDDSASVTDQAWVRAELEIDQWRDRILGRISRRDISQNKSRIGMKRKVF